VAYLLFQRPLSGSSFGINKDASRKASYVFGRASFPFGYSEVEA